MKHLTADDWHLIEVALHMAAHEYLATYRDVRGEGPEAQRCAAQRNRISRLLPLVEQNRRITQNEELLGRARA